MNRNSGPSQAQCHGFGGGCDKNCNIRSLLRLDSVGEVSSGRKPVNLNNQHRGGVQNKQSNHTNSTMTVLQPTSFLGACKSLTCSNQPNPSNTFVYLKGIFMCNNNPEQIYTSTDITNRNTDIGANMDYHCRVISKTSRRTFDAFCSSHIQQRMVFPQCQKYVPPPLRVGHENTKPCKTPYNARLLANSRKSESGQPKLFANFMNKQMGECDNNELGNSDDIKEIKLSVEFVKCIPPEDRAPNEEEEWHQNTCDKTNNADSVEKESCAPGTDWFEYNCQSKYVPIVITEDKLQGKRSSEKVESGYTNSQHSEKQTGIHSWFCNDIEEKVKKTANSQLPSHYSEKVSDECDIVKCDDVQAIEEKCIGTDKDVLSCKSNSSTMKTSTLEQDIITDSQPAVLFCRSAGKKARPSKKKRRQQKSRQKDSLVNDSGGAVNQDSRASLKVDPTVCINIHSFQFTCDSDSSDWSDNESDFDEDFSSLEEDGALGLRCNDPFTSLNIASVSCSVPKACENETAASSSRLQAINNSWQSQIESQPTQQKQSIKQVHFAADDDLATVHTIIAWRHAYAAARKGPWEEYARDRDRFARRIQDCATVLGPILSSTHRSNVFSERFATNDN